MKIFIDVSKKENEKRIVKKNETSEILLLIQQFSNGQNESI